MVRIRKPASRPWNSIKTRMRTAGQSALKAALPLVTSAMISCSAEVSAPEIPVEQSCDQHNDTTIVLNETEFDDERRVAGVRRLRMPDGFMGEELVHAVRASHSLSTEGLTREFRTSFTQLDEECFYNPDVGLYGTAYAITPENNEPGGNLGIYTHLPALNLDDFSMISHEIGHLQTPHGEVGAEANSAEQMLMLFVVYSNQENSTRDENMWAAQATNQFYGLEALRDALRHIYQETFRLDPDPAVSMSLHPKWKYIKADIFILESLRRTGGDFSALREELGNLWREDFLIEAQDRVDRFVDRYSFADLETSRAEIINEIRMAHYSELMRRHGAEAADEYFNSTSHAAYWFEAPRKFVRVNGLEDLNCMTVRMPENTPEIQCDQACTEFGATAAVQITDAQFLCFSVEEDGFQNWNVTASGVHYAGMSRRITLNGAAYDSVMVFDQRQMDPVEPR